MRFALSLLASAAVAAACSASTSHEKVERDTPLQVRLEHEGDTKVTISITNNDSIDYRLLNEGTILDPAPVRKLRVRNGTHDATFHGMEKRIDLSRDLGEKAFTTIASGQTVTGDFDIAAYYDLDDESYDVFANGNLPFANGNSTRLSGRYLPFSSNKLLVAVDATKASQVTKAINKLDLKKRTTVESDCSSDQASAITAASQNCASLASAAADAACSGSTDTFQSYFKDSSTTTRDKVADLFRKIATECGSTPGGKSESSCSDPQGSCGGNLIAYTVWSETYSGDGTTTSRDEKIYYCPLYFSMPASTPEQCHQQCRGSNTLHEMTHAIGSTKDVAYGYQAVMGLSSSQALDNADTYALYANDIALKCTENGKSNSGYSGSGSWPGSSGGVAVGGGAETAAPSTASSTSAPPSSDSGASSSSSEQPSTASPPSSSGSASADGNISFSGSASGFKSWLQGLCNKGNTGSQMKALCSWIQSGQQS